MTRIVGDFLYFLITSLVRDRVLNGFEELRETKRSITVNYKIIGIRPSVESLAREVSKQVQDVEIVGFNGFSEILEPNMLDPSATRIIHARSLSLGEIGCARSHQLAYQRPNDCDWTIFLEDDILLVGNLAEVETKLALLSNEPSVVLLDFGHDLIIKLPFWKKRNCTHAYAINRKALELINQTYTSIWTVADWPLQWVFNISFKTLGQFAVKLDSELPSLIEGGRQSKKQESIAVMRKSGSSSVVADSALVGSTSGLQIYSLYKFLRGKNVKSPLITAFLACKSGLYSSGTK